VEGITDDHLFVNQLGKIPMIDIVHYQAGIGFFGDYHHATKDNMNIISKETLGAVGNTLLNVIYYEE
jgi:glutaminyl-peptide cyclotransferase